MASTSCYSDSVVSDEGGPSKRLKLSKSEDDWQSTKQKVAERFEFIYNSELYADIHFIVGNGNDKQRIPAHKLVLVVGSVVFDRMFSDRWTPASDDIPVADVEPSAFLALLKFLYSDMVTLTADTVTSVMYAAKKYDVQALEKLCVDFLLRNLNPTNVFTILAQADLFSELPLKESCLKIIDEDTIKVTQSEGFTSIDLDTLCSVLKRDTLSIKEFDLFQATVRWAEAECRRKELVVNTENQKFVLKDSLNLLRFHLMSMDEFSAGVASTELLSDSQLVPVFMLLSNRKTPRLPNRNYSPRICSNLIANRFLDVLGDRFCLGKNEYFSFRTDRDVKLLGIGIYGSPEENATYKVNFGLYHDMDFVSIVLKSWEGHQNPDKRIQHLFFDLPVPLNGRQNYRVEYSIQGHNSYRGINKKMSVCLTMPHDGTKMTICYSYYESYYDPAPTDRGQLPEFLFGL